MSTPPLAPPSLVPPSLAPPPLLPSSLAPPPLNLPPYCRKQKCSRKGNGGEQNLFPALLPFSTEIAYSFCTTWRKRKYFEIRNDVKLKDQRISIATGLIPNVCLLCCPPWFSLQNTFNDDLQFALLLLVSPGVSRKIHY
jgi:hypothetical protein